MNGRILLVTSGSYGDVNPFIGLALELQRRGYRTAIFTMPCWRTWVEDAGIKCESIEWDMPATHETARWVNPAALMEMALASYRKLSRLVSGDDLIVSLSMVGLGPLMAAPLVAEAQRIPWVAAILEPLSFFSEHDTLTLPSFGGQPAGPAMGPATRGSRLWWYQRLFSLECRCVSAMGAAMQMLRPMLGLSPPKERDSLAEFRAADLVLALFSHALAPSQPDWPRQTEVPGFVWCDGHEQESWPAELEQFLNDGPPPIVFTLSSDGYISPDPGFATKCVFAANSIGRRAVIIGSPFAGHPRDMCFVPRASFRKLFTRGAAVVHHGGIGTTALALRAGKPMIVVPGGYSQPDTAARLQRLGVARVIPRRNFNGATAAIELAELLKSPACSETAEKIGAIVSREDGASNACDSIEKLIANGKPAGLRRPISSPRGP